MKRCALILACIIFCSLIPCDIALADTEIVQYENFENDEYLGFTRYSEGRENAGTIKETDVYGMNKVLSPSQWSARSDAFGSKTYIIDKAAYYENLHNLYLETEFDIIIPQSSIASPMISLMNNEDTILDGTFPFTITLNSEAEKIQLSCKETRRGASKINVDLCDFEKGVPYRIKAVMHITDDTDATCEEISKIFVNGDNVLLSPKYLVSDNENKIPYVNSIIIRNANGILFDNLTLYRYVSADGKSPVINKGRLISLIRSTSAYNISEVDNAKSLCENSSSSQAEIDTAYENLKKTLSPTVLYNEDFDGEMVHKFYANRNIGEITGEESGKTEASDIYPFGKVYSTQNGSINTETFEKVYVFDDGLANGVSTSEAFSSQPDNLNLETEFDIAAINSECNPTVGLACDLESGTVGTSIRLNTKEKKLQLVCRDGKRGSGKLQNVNLCALEIGKFYRIKFVISVKDAVGDSAEMVRAVYVDGVNMLKQPQYFESYSVGKIPYFNRLRIINAKSALVDNIKIGKYVSLNGVSPSADKGKLISLLRKYQEYFSKLTADNEFYGIYNSADEIYRDEDAECGAINMICKKMCDAEIYPFTVKSYISEVNGKSGQFIYEDGTLKTVTVSKNYGSDYDSRFFMSTYDNHDVLMGVNMCTVQLSDDETTLLPEFKTEYPKNGGYVKMLLMTEEMMPLASKVTINPQDENLLFADTEIYVNGEQYRTDSKAVVHNDGRIMVCAENLINLFGMQLMKDGDKFSCTRADGKTLRYDSTSHSAEISGITSEICVENGLIDIDILKKAFECDYKLIGMDNGARLEISYDYSEPEYNDYSTAGIEMKFTQNTPFDIDFEIPYSNTEANMEVWIKMSAPSSEMWSSAMKGCRDNGAVYYWKKAYSLHYDETKKSFCGSMGDLPSGRRAYDIKLAVTENGVQNTYIKREAFMQNNDYSYPKLNDYVYHTGGELMLVPTYENMGFYIDNSIPCDICEIYYKSEEESVWNEAYEPYYDADDNQWRGSITGLKENTQYTVKAVLKASDNTYEKISSVRTWRDNPNVERTIEASQFLDNGTLNIQGIKGTEDSWIKITSSDGLEINGGENNTEAVYISDCKYVILDSLKIIGGKRTGVIICNGSSDVRIINCDISGWGRTGVLDEIEGAYRADGGTINYESGIRMFDVKNITVERCYIHDSRSKTTPWVGETWRWEHPKGSCGICYRVKDGCVIRYNDIIGCDDYRWNDAIEGADNGARFGGANKNTDIYGNMLFGCEDDCVEIDGGQMNVRVYNNRMEQGLCGISTAPNLAGPSYIFRNIITNMGTSNVRYIGTAVKSGGGDDPVGTMYMFNNTIDSICHAVRNVGYDKSTKFHSVSRNNIFVTRTDGYDSFTNKYADEADSNDYDMTYGRVSLKSGDGVHNISELPEYESLENGDYRLREESAAVDNGEILNNFTKNYNGTAPDLGAIEKNSEISFIPHRPIDISTDKYMVTLREGEETEMTFTPGAAENGHTYHILKNDGCEWLQISEQATDEILKNGLPVTVKLSVIGEKCKTVSGNCVILLRLDNGYSIPISIKLIRQ